MGTWRKAVGEKQRDTWATGDSPHAEPGRRLTEAHFGSIRRILCLVACFQADSTLLCSAQTVFHCVCFSLLEQWAQRHTGSLLIRRIYCCLGGSFTQWKSACLLSQIWTLPATTNVVPAQHSTALSSASTTGQFILNYSVEDKQKRHLLLKPVLAMMQSSCSF